MAGYQFVHLATYSRKGNGENLSVDEIAQEAARLPGATTHLADPKPPILHFGVMPDEVPALIEQRIADAKKAIRAARKADPEADIRATRVDTHVLVTIVASHPYFVGPAPEGYEHVGSLTDPDARARYDRWRGDTVDWAISEGHRLGATIVSAVEHTDERHGHLHFLYIPDGLRVDAKQCHPGLVAAAGVTPMPGETTAQTNARRTKELKRAMTAWQDRYYREIGAPNRLLRTGPRRARLDRPRYIAQQQTADALVAATERLTQGALAAAQGIIFEAETAAARKISDARRELIDGEVAVEALDIARTTIEREVHQLSRQRDHLAPSLEALQHETSEAERDLNSVRYEAYLIERENEEATFDLAQRRRDAAAEAERVVADAKAQAEHVLRIAREDAISVEKSSAQRGATIIAKAHADAATAAAQAQARETELTRRSLAIDDQAQLLTKLVNENSTTRTDHAIWRAKLVAREVAVSTRETDVGVIEASVAAREATIKAREIAVVQKEAACDAKSAALDAWAAGTLRPGPLIGGQETFDFPKGEAGRTLSDRIAPAVNWVWTQLNRLETEVAERVERTVVQRVAAKMQGVAEAIRSTFEAWARGLIVGVVRDVSRKTQPEIRFSNERPAEVEVLAPRIRPQAALAALIVGMLPERSALTSIRTRMETTSALLTEAERRETERLKAEMDALAKAASVGAYQAWLASQAVRGGPGR